MPGFVAVNLFGVLFVRYEYEPMFRVGSEWTNRVIRHEEIHTAQMMEMLYIGFYLWYMFEWLIRLVVPPWATAYADIAFEREAYTCEDITNYAERRKAYSWIKYLRKK